MVNSKIIILIILCSFVTFYKANEQTTNTNFLDDNLYFCFKEYCTPKKDPLMIYANESPIKNIIFDLNEVLIETKTKVYIKKIPHLFPFLFQRLFRRESFNIKKFFENAIADIPAKSKVSAYHEGKALPPIMNDWQCGENVYRIVMNHIEQKEIPKSDKNFLKAIAETFFNPEKFAASKRPIAHVIQMLRDLREAGYKLYVLSNWDAQSFPIFQKQYTEIMNLFDGIMISGDVGLIKPDPKIYKKCLKKFKIKACESLFIDDQKINVDAAETIGISGFLFDHSNKKSIQETLQEYGIVKSHL